MPRDHNDLHQVLTAFTGWIRERPEAGVIVGTVRVGRAEDGYSTQIGHVDCCPVSLVALASELMQAAAEKLCAAPDEGDGRRELIMRIERARVELGFEQDAASA